ncbi:MAG: vanadium-dependent haloperoxidase [Cyclobacteriaceae bacterium]|nr:vanadium-dependent haloperoxidase [Cyclobacteriaceae bacterium]MDW8332044.1 vanadium-dependent haloperoxidase [Cyclobacteriaceae bacterium]
MKKYVLLIGIIVTACTRNNVDYGKTTSNPQHLHRMMKAITDRMVHDIFSPPVASRVYAYASIAAYEALVPFSETYNSLSGQIKHLTPVPEPEKGVEYSPELVSLQALYKVGRQLIFSEQQLDSVYQDIINTFKISGMPGSVFNRSLDYGNKVGEHILKWASGDNYHQTRSFPKYTIRDDPATWRPTPPAYFDAVEPHWTKIRPFVMDSSTQFAPPPPTPFSTDKNSQFYKEAFQVYQTGKNLTKEQREIASFWDCNPFAMQVHGHVMFGVKKISPGGHWINITREACEKANADFIRSAEAYACVAIALADGFISCWDEKYRSVLVRPETYINRYIDENWVPLLQTPPFPEYTSGHSVISAAAAVTLTKLFGDNFAFVDSTEAEFGLPPRSFTSFLQAASEAGISRLYGGIHYLPAIENGQKQGRSVGELVISRIRTRRELTASAHQHELQ